MRLYEAAKNMFNLAIKYYEEVPQESPNWLQSLFEESWAFFMLDAELRRIFKQDFAGFQKALGNIHTLNAPFFETQFFPETFILRAVIYFRNCRYKAASESVREFQKLYMPLFESLKKVVVRHQDDNNEYYNFAIKVIKGTSDLEEVIGRFAKTALTDRTLKRQFDYVEELDRELKQVEAAARDWKTTAIADSIVQDLSLQKSLAIARAGEMSVAGSSASWTRCGPCSCAPTTSFTRWARCASGRCPPPWLACRRRSRSRSRRSTWTTST